jgi:hypothetical protein
LVALALLILFVLVFRVVVGTTGSLTHLVAQRTTCDGTCSRANRPGSGTHGCTHNSTANGSCSFTSVPTSDVGHVSASIIGLVATSAVLIAIVVLSHPFHFLFSD